MGIPKLGGYSGEIATSTVQDVSIDAVYPELIELILALNSPKEILSFGATCKKYYSISHRPTLWGSLFLQHFPHVKAADEHLNLYKELVVRKKNIRSNIYKQHVLGFHEDAIKTLLIKGNCLYTGSFNGIVLCWDLTARQCIHEKNYGQELYCFEIDEEFIYTGARDWLIRRWDMKTDKPPKTLEGHQGVIHHLQVVGSYLLSGSMDGTIKIWDKGKRECKYTVTDLNRHTITPFKADKKFLYIGLDNGTIRILNVSTGDPLQSFKASEKWRVNCLEVYGGCLYAGLQDSTIAILDIATGACLYSLDIEDGMPFSLQIEGDCLYVGLFNGIVKVLDLTTNEWLQTFEDFKGSAMRFKAIRNCLYVHSQDHLIRMLDFGDSPDKLG